MPSKRVHRWTPLLVAGTLLMVLGGGLAALVGPDDTIRIGTHTVPTGATGLAVATHPEVTAFRDVGMLVEASAPGGVFLATTRRVDTQSLLDGTERYEIGRVAWGTVGGHMRPDGAPATFVALQPTSILGWNSVSPDMQRLDDGTIDPELPDEAELVVDLDGIPIDVVVIPRDPEARVTIALGAHVAHLFVLQVAVAWTGALLVLVWWLLRVRRMRRDRRATDGPTDPPTDPPNTDPADEKPPASTGSTGSRWNSSALPSYPRAGDSTTESLGAKPETLERESPAPESPKPTTATTTPPTKAPSTSTQPRRLPHAITLPILAVLLIGLATSGCSTPSSVSPEGERPGGPPLSLADAALVSDGEPRAVLAPTFTSYPVWAVVELPPKDGKGTARLQLLTRDSFRSPWTPAGTVRLGVAPPTATEFPTEVSDVVRKEADAAADEIARFWMTGRTGEVRIGKSTKQARKALLAAGIRGDSVWVTGEVESNLNVVSVEDGHLVLVRQTMATTGGSKGTTQRRLTSAVLIGPGAQTVVLGSTVKPAG